MAGHPDSLACVQRWRRGHTSHQPNRLGPCSKMSIWSAMPADIPLLPSRGVLPEFQRHFKALMGSPADMANPLLFFMVVTLFLAGTRSRAVVCHGTRPTVGGGAFVEFDGEQQAVWLDYEDGSLGACYCPLSSVDTGDGGVAAHWLATGFLLRPLPLFGIILGLPAAGLGVLSAAGVRYDRLTLIAIGSALTVSIRRGGLLCRY